jgi:hypothetical protein
MRYHVWQNIPIMARTLVWLENGTFGAWGCDKCGWLTPSRTESIEAPVKEAFNKHECAKFPRFTQSPARSRPTKDNRGRMS